MISGDEKADSGCGWRITLTLKRGSKLSFPRYNINRALHFLGVLTRKKEPAEQRLIRVSALFIISIAGILIYTIFTLQEHHSISGLNQIADTQRLLVDRYFQETLLTHRGMGINREGTQNLMKQNLNLLIKNPPTDEISDKLFQEKVLLQLYLSETDPAKLLRIRDELSILTEDISHEYRLASSSRLVAMLRVEIAFGCLMALLAIVLTRQIRWSEGRLRKEEAERKAVEDTVRLLERSIDTTQIGITITDASGRILYVNPAEAEMHGYTVSELTGKDVRIFAPPERWEANTIEQIKDMNCWRRESVNIRKDGTLFSVQLMSDVVIGPEGEPTGIVTTCEDITERKRAEQTLRESELKFRSVAESAVDALILVDGSGNIIFWNHVAEKIFGYLEREVAGKSFTLLLPERNREAHRRTLEKMITSSGPRLAGRRFELEGLRKEGSEFPLELSIGFWEIGGQTYYTVVARDITRRRLSEKQLRESEERYRSLVETARDIIATLSLEGTITSLNIAFEKSTGWNRDDWIGKHFAPLVHADDLNSAQKFFQRVLAGESTPIAQLRVLQKDGAFRYVESKAVLQMKDGKPVGVLTVARDISRRKKAEDELQKYREQLEHLVETRTVELTETNRKLQTEILERMRVEQALRESEERYVLAVRGAQDGLWDWNLEINEIYFSPRWKWMLGYPKEEIGNTPDEWFNRIHPEDIEKVKVEIFAHLEGLTDHFENEHRMLQKDGKYRWILSRGLAVRDATGKAYRVAGSQTDIVERKRIEEKLAQQAFYDPLTQLPNRALFMDRLGQALKRANRRRDFLFALLYLDLDHFKEVNDTMGHLLGDQLLVQVARKLEECLRPSDSVARMGGDEFTILLDDIKDLSDATHIADRIWKELNSAFYISGHEVRISASIGITLSSKGYQQPEELLQDADTALYRAKGLGRARHEVFDASLQTKAGS